MTQPVMINDPDGTQEWRMNGKLHREDGPAVINPNGAQRCHLNDKPIENLGLLKLNLLSMIIKITKLGI